LGLGRVLRRAAELTECGAIALGLIRQVGVANSGAVAAHVDGVHDREGAADAEGEAEKEADHCRPGEAHAGLSLQPARRAVGGGAWRLSGLPAALARRLRCPAW